MATEVVMPKMGYDMEEGTILRWIKAEGDTVKKGDVLAEIETGKVNIEIEAFDPGILRIILVGEGETVPVGTPIALVGSADEVIERPAKTEAAAGGANGRGSSDAAVTEAEVDPAKSEAAATGGAAAGATASDGAGRLRASPLARRMAAEHGLDLARIAPGTGPHGRVVRDDVESALATGAPAAVPALAPVRRADTVEDMSRMRQTIARRLSDSWTQAPHIFLTMAIDMDRCLALRAEVNSGLAKLGEAKVSVNDFIVKAAARSLARHPSLNVSFDDGRRVVRGGIHVGVAVALEDGLVTVTVPDADSRSLSAIAADVRDKADRARAGKLQPADFETPSTFTVSNLGMYGIEAFTAIINPPEAAILAIGAAVPTPVVRDGAVVVRSIMRITLSADHRVVDGATAAEFLVTLADLLEHPATLLA